MTIFCGGPSGEEEGENGSDVASTQAVLVVKLFCNLLLSLFSLVSKNELRNLVAPAFLFTGKRCVRIKSFFSHTEPHCRNIFSFASSL